MSSTRHSKNRTTKPPSTTHTRNHNKLTQELSSTLANSRSISRFKHTHKSKNQIPKILTRLERDVQDLRKYCSDITPHLSKKKHDKQQHPADTIRTLNDHADESNAEIESVQKSYMSMYGKNTDNLLELWNFYNSFVGRPRGGKGSTSSHSASIGAMSQQLPDYSIDSRRDSGRCSVMGLTGDPSKEDNGNISELFSNGPRERIARGEVSQRKKPSQKQIEEEEEMRPLQVIEIKRTTGAVRSVEFNLVSELKHVSPAQQLHDPQILVDIPPPPEGCRQMPQIPLLRIKDSETDCPDLSSAPLGDSMKSQAQDDPKELFQKIFEKNMLINKRKQEINAKLQKGKTEVKVDLDQRVEALDEAIIVDQNRPMMIEQELPLSKQDISLLEKLDYLDKENVNMKTSGENCVFEALKEIKKKKSFQKSKFTVSEIPSRKVPKQPKVVDIQFDELRVPSPKAPSVKCKKGQLSNSSLLDCEIQAAEGEDSMLLNMQDIEIDL